MVLVQFYQVIRLKLIIYLINIEKNIFTNHESSHNVNSDGWYTTLETQFRELLPSLKNNVFKKL